MKKHILLIVLVGVLLSCNQSSDNKQHQSPEKIYGELFVKVQTQAIFPDSKTFVDCIPKIEPSKILALYNEQKSQPNFDLKKFVYQYFNLPKAHESNFQSNPNFTAEQHINALWSVLTRKPEDDKGSLISLRRSYIVPGGRFNEIYYWDSYFTMLGLQTSKKDTVIGNMVLNFAQMIQDYGHIPNGSRFYYLSRSQPPFFFLMVRLLSETLQDKNVYIKFLPQMQREYQYWMAVDGSEQVEKQTQALKKGAKAYRKAVFVVNKQVLNRYFDDSDTPRPEAYKEDIAVAKKSGRKANEVYRDLRSAAESGFDFSSRWFKNEKTLETIHTTDILPVDLNALLYGMETTLAEAYEIKGERNYATSMQKLAEKRKQIFDTYFWNEEAGFYFDYDFVAGKQKNVYSLAGVYPLVFNLASPAQAQKVAKVLETKFLQAGGLTTTLNQTGQQWDAPNGWAPLQWMAIVGLRNYGQNHLANQIKKNWVENNLRVYKNTGKMVEKYNVFDTSLKAGGGEYALQDGFGWTNGVLLRLLSEK